MLIEMQAWFFVLMAVGNEPSNQMHDTIGRTAMARMLDLRDILELIDNGLDNRPFAQQELVGEMDEPIVHVDPFGITNFQRRRVDEADARAGSIAGLQIGKQRKHHLRDERNKARITHQMRKFLCQMHLDMFRVVRFECSIVGLVKMDQNRHHLAWVQLAYTVSLFARFQLHGFPLGCKAEHAHHRYRKTIRVNSLRDPCDGG
jgi:hypothetical protein